MDFDGDNILDIVSGVYYSDPAPVYYFKGTEKTGFFHAAKPILTVAGEVPRSTVRSKTAGTPREPRNIQCCKQHLADLNGDGLLDLVYGEVAGYFTRFDGVKKGEGMNFSEKASFLTYSDGKILSIPLQVYKKYANPHFVDWDNDGDLDLLSGSSSGGVFYFENNGTKEVPTFEKPINLIEVLKPYTDRDPVSYYIISRDLERKRPQYVTSVTTVDYNGDGKLDLVVGDHFTEMTKLPEVTEDEFKAKEAAYKTIDLSVIKLRQYQEEFMTKKDVGCVWVLLRK